MDLFLKNMTNQGDRVGDIVLLDKALIFVAPGGLYLRWFLYGELVSDSATKIVMVVECWRSDDMFFARCEHEKNVVSVPLYGTIPKLP